MVALDTEAGVDAADSSSIRGNGNADGTLCADEENEKEESASGCGDDCNTWTSASVKIAVHSLARVGSYTTGSSMKSSLRTNPMLASTRRQAATCQILLIFSFSTRSRLYLSIPKVLFLTMTASRCLIDADIESSFMKDRAAILCSGSGDNERRRAVCMSSSAWNSVIVAVLLLLLRDAP